MRNHMSTAGAVLVIAAVATLTAACGKKNDEARSPGSGGEVIKIDGSSTVFPISQAVAEEFEKEHGGHATVGVSGTGGGFKKFCRGEIAVTGASRPIKTSEVEACKAAGIEYVEIPVAYDGLAIVVHPENYWVESMTVAELKRIWEPAAGEKITRWNQVRTSWPDKELHLFGPGTDSGTYDYFTEAVVGKEHASRGDFTSSEDDNVLVQGVSTDPAALGFFGFAYYAENTAKLKLVAIDDEDGENGEGPIEPGPETIANGTYQPLSRPIFVYVSTEAAKRPEIEKFVNYYLTAGTKLVSEVGYVALPEKAYALARERFAARKTGSMFEKGAQVGVTVEALLSGS